MIGSTVSAGSARIVGGQSDWIFTPKYGGADRYGVVLLHGQLQTGQEWWSQITPQQSRIAYNLLRFPMVSIYASGVSWGNAASDANIETARAWLSALGCPTDKIIIVGASMGALVGLNYMRNHPTRVAAYLGIMPPGDLDDIRDNDRGSARDNVNTAWSLALGSTSATVPLPAEANPSADANAALIKTANCPKKLYYSSADAIAIPSTVTALAAKLGIGATLISDSLTHSDALFGAVPMDEVVDIIERVI